MCSVKLFWEIHVSFSGCVQCQKVCFFSLTCVFTVANSACGHFGCDARVHGLQGDYFGQISLSAFLAFGNYAAANACHGEILSTTSWNPHICILPL
jgi:hypothetical protein